MKILNEVYFGKNKNLIQIERDFQTIIDEYNNSSLLTFTLDASPVCKKALSDIENILQNEFGFGKVVITVTYAISGMNAITFLQPFNKKITNKFIKTKDGMRCVSSNANLVIMLSSGILKHGLTAGELTAILLHEVGHNFFSNNNLSTIILQEFTEIPSYIQNPINLLSTVEYDLIISNVLPYFIKFTKTTGIKTVVDTLNMGKRFSSLVWTIVNIPNIMFRFGSMVARQIQKAPFNLIKMASGSASEEKFSDNFATAYGYGADLSSALSKMTITPSSDIDKIIILRPIMDILNGPTQILVYLTDCHPNAYARILDQISYAKSQLNSVKDPRVKKILNGQIKQMEEAAETYKKLAVKTNLKNGKPISALISAITIALGGKSLQSLFDTKDKKTGDWKQFKTTKSIFD